MEISAFFTVIDLHSEILVERSPIELSRFFLFQKKKSIDKSEDIFAKFHRTHVIFCLSSYN